MLNLRLILLFLSIGYQISAISISNNADNSNTKCMQIDIVFALPNSVTIDPVYYNTTIKSFVSTVINAFSASDEVEHGSRQFGRYALVQTSNEFRHMVPFADRTRSELNQFIDGIYYESTNNHSFTSIIWEVISADLFMDGDLNRFNLSSTTTNRVLVLLLDQFKMEYVDEYEYLDRTHKIRSRFPYIIGIGVNGTEGNQIAEDKSKLIDLVGGYPERVFGTLDEALNSNNDLLNLLSRYMPCSIKQCSGYGFWFQDVNSYWLSGKMFMDASKQIIPKLNPTNNGFSTMYIFGLHYSPVYYTQQGSIDWLNWYQSFTGFLSDYTNTSRAVLFDAMLEAIESSMYNNYGFFLYSETDSEDYNYEKSLELAYKIQSYNLPIYILDTSVHFYEKQQLFKIITNNKPGRILNMTDVMSTDDIVNFFEQPLVSDFTNLGCNKVTPSPVITPVPTTEPLKCSGIIFALEMSTFITKQAKMEFFALARKIVNTLGDGHYYGFVEFGISVYRNSSLLNSKDILKVIDQVENNFNSTGQPTNQVVYLNPALVDIVNTVRADEYYPDFRFTVLLASEVDGIWDPADAYDESKFIQNYEKLDVYVIDYSSFSFQSILFPVLTGKEPNHIMNGTTHTSDDFFNWLKPTMINDVNNNKC